MPLDLNNEDLARYQNTLATLNSQVSQMLWNSSQDTTTKLDLLTSLEQSEYQSLLKLLSCKQSKEELQLLVDVFESIGDIKCEIGKLSSKINSNSSIKYYTDSAIYYQYVISLLNEKFDPQADLAIQTRLNTIRSIKLHLLGQNILSDITGKDIDSIPTILLTTVKLFVTSRSSEIELFKTLARDVEDLRTSGKDDEYTKASSNLFNLISENLISTLKALYEESEKELSSLDINKPCSYSVIGLGSLALNQATPYSDFEFAIITAKEVPNDYFTNLTHLVHFKVIALGETKLDNSLSHLIHRGRAFDSGGHTPLGSDTRAALIGTVERLTKLLEQEFTTDKLLPYILTRAVHITGDEHLSENDQQAVISFLQSPSKTNPSLLNHQEMALSVLRTEFKPLSQREEGKLFNVKQEIYRLERLVHHLGLYFMKDGDSAIITINNLEKDNIINKEAADNLRFSIAFASMLRLNTYLANQGQRENLSLSAQENLSQKEGSQVFHLSTDELIEDGALFKFFYIALGLYSKLNEFCTLVAVLDENDKQRFFTSSYLYSDDNLSKGAIHYRLTHYKEAINMLRITPQTPHTSDKTFYKVKDTSMSVTFSQASSTSGNFDKLGKACSELGDHDMATHYYTRNLENLEIKNLIWENQFHSEIATCLNNLAIIYYRKGDYANAVKYVSNALLTSLRSPDHPHIQSIQNILTQSAIKFADQCILSSETVYDYILMLAQRNIEFANHATHLRIALSLIEGNDSEQAEYKIFTLRLAWIFTLKDDVYTKVIILQHLSLILTSNQESTEFILSILDNNVFMVQELLLSPDAIDPNIRCLQLTPLIIAIYRANEELVNILLTHPNIDINKPDSQGASPLYYSLGFAGQPIDLSIVDLLLFKGAKTNQPMKDGDTPMHMAHHVGNKEAIKLLMQYGGLLTNQNQDGKTPLHCLLESEMLTPETKTSVVEALMDQYVSSNILTIKDHAGNFPIDSARLAELPNIVELLQHHSVTAGSQTTDLLDQELQQALALSLEQRHYIPDQTHTTPPLGEDRDTLT